MFELIFKKYFKRGTIHIFIFSFLVFIVLNVIENVIHYNIGKYHEGRRDGNSHNSGASSRRVSFYKPRVYRLGAYCRDYAYFCDTTRGVYIVFQRMLVERKPERVALPTVSHLSVIYDELALNVGKLRDAHLADNERVSHYVSPITNPLSSYSERISQTLRFPSSRSLRP